MKRKRSRKTLKIIRNFVCIFLFALIFIVYKTKKIKYEQIKSQLYTSALKFLEFEEQQYVNKLQPDTLKRLIAKYNREEKVLNLDIHGSIRPNGPVFVIFVGKYKANLKYLVTSLQHVVGISDTMIIFSHSYFDENVNNLIKSIEFARVVQIFYPYSLQVYPNTFSVRKYDYTDDMTTDTQHNCSKGTKQKAHGRYIDPELAQSKHFWWWTMNHVFKHLSHTKDHKGMFIFLEDDVFLMQDFIYMTLQMKQISKLIFQCDFVSLHTTGEPDFYETNTDGASIKTWDPNEHSSVLAFDSYVWNVIATHDHLFCNFDDYSWSRTLFYLSLNRRDGRRFKVISSTMPRAYTTSSLTGASDPFIEYNIVSIVHKALEMQKRNHGNFYPLQLEIFVDIELDYDDFVNSNRMGNSGHWSDPRNKNLCIKISGRKSKQEAMAKYKESFKQLYN